MVFIMYHILIVMCKGILTIQCSWSVLNMKLSKPPYESSLQCKNVTLGLFIHLTTRTGAILKKKLPVVSKLCLISRLFIHPVRYFSFYSTNLIATAYYTNENKCFCHVTITPVTHGY